MSKQSSQQRLDLARSMLSGLEWEATGLSRKTFLKWAQGISGPRLEDLIRIQEETGISLDWLATGDGPMYLAERGPAAQEELERQVFLRTVVTALDSIAKTALEMNSQPIPQALDIYARSLFDLYKRENLRSVEGQSTASIEPQRRKKEAANDA